LAEGLRAEGAPLVAIEAEENLRARRAYEGAGFRFEAKIVNEPGPGVVMAVRAPPRQDRLALVVFMRSGACLESGAGRLPFMNESRRLARVAQSRVTPPVIKAEDMDHEFRGAEDRRAAIVALARQETGIGEAMIEMVVRAFYGRVREDPLLAPIFESRISEWEPHLEAMFAFWSSLTLQTGRYHGQPMAKHMPLAVDARHFDRWLALFEETARDLCSPAAAERFIERARRVAESLELGVASANGVPLGKGERYRRTG